MAFQSVIQRMITYFTELCTCSLPSMEDQSLQNVSSSVMIDDYLVTITIMKKSHGQKRRLDDEPEGRSLYPKIQEKSYVSSMKMRGQSPTYDSDSYIYNVYGHNF